MAGPYFQVSSGSLFYSLLAALGVVVGLLVALRYLLRNTETNAEAARRARGEPSPDSMPRARVVSRDR